MNEYIKKDEYTLYSGSMLDMNEKILPNSVDAIVTDPPYELGFMGKGWDKSGIAFQKETWEKCLQVLKPGGYLLAFGGSRTFHRIACAIEDAGFEIRDTIMWIYGSGFPKSMALDKAIEGKLTIGSANTKDFKKLNGVLADKTGLGFAKNQFEQGIRPTNYNNNGQQFLTQLEPTTELSKQYTGWGTALKPAFEPIIIARKPFNGTLVDNVIAYGVGGINIDGCRVPSMPGEYDIRHYTNEDCFQNVKPKSSKFQVKPQPDGRFPANVILTYDETDEQEVCSGFPIGGKNGSISKPYKINNTIYGEYGDCKPFTAYDDSGSASRYFYCAKASQKDRDEGLDDLNSSTIQPCKNSHPTVKPAELMQYLIRLVTPKNATILDPFMGSGSTGKARMIENAERHSNYKFVGIELTDEYLPIAHARIEFGVNYTVSANPKKVIKTQSSSSAKNRLF